VIAGVVSYMLLCCGGGRYRPKHIVFFSIANKHHHLAI